MTILPRQRCDYLERIGRVMAYLHDHLAEEISLERLAEVAHLSPYHWHRVYHALQGETIAQTLRRLRLQRGSAYLANTGLAVAEIARRCGYPNAQSFTRAFRGAFGCGPSEYRARGSHVAFRSGGSAPLEAGYQVELRRVPALVLAGLPHRGSYMGVGKAFELAYAKLAAVGLARPDSRWLAVYLDDPAAVPEAQLASRAGLVVPADAEPPPPLQRWELGDCECAVLRHRGPYATMRAAYQWLYGHWLVQSGREAADAPVFEEYLNHPRMTAPAELLTDIYLPLAP
ncbi:AraC family transcriptional regulator [Roseateles sp. DAIF2]|uniref:AraC family transcriptional regulator n=1 Tax=Roseateles sp. DAIF2 TaxID=2714952 RepID=UPI0018A2C4AC|nr:AraC family transcriptional regulator [Roseateles sp. DAIF2]QPF72120.1 AraC family transcriptional regulator [Roseateles sp. DAIF2]